MGASGSNKYGSSESTSDSSRRSITSADSTDRKFKQWTERDARRENSNYDYDVDVENATRNGGYYVSTGHSFSLNSYLRDGDFGTDRRYDREIRDIDAHMRPLSESINVYRYVDTDCVRWLLDQAGISSSIPDISHWSGSAANRAQVVKKLANLIGGTVSDKGFLSTSYDKDANVFKTYPVMLNLGVPKGTMAFVPNNHGESEVVLHRDSSYEITGVHVEKMNGRSYIVIDGLING